MLSRRADGKSWSKMKPELAAAYHKLGILHGDDLIKIAEYWLRDGIVSDSTAILAGEADSTLSEVAPRFEKALEELGVPIPSEAEAARTVLISYLEQIVDGQVSPFEGMAAIERNVYLNVSEEADEKYVGDSLGIEHMYTWYRELIDAHTDSPLFYYTDLPKEQAVQKFNEHLLKEAEKLLAMLKFKQ